MGKQIEFGELEIHLLFDKADAATMDRVEEYFRLHDWESSIDYEFETPDGWREFETWPEFRSFLLEQGGSDQYVSWWMKKTTHSANVWFSINRDSSLVVGFSDGFHSVEPAAKRLIELATELDAVAGYVDWEGGPASDRNEFLTRSIGWNYASITSPYDKPQSAGGELPAPRPSAKQVSPSENSTGFKVVDSLESIRKRPGMYIGSTHDAGNQVVRELVANALDQHLRGEVSRIIVKTGYDFVEVTDDGPGVLFHPKAMEYLTTIHSTASADSHAPHVHVGLRGAGLATLNGLASHMSVESWKSGKGLSVRFEAGRRAGPNWKHGGPSPDGTTVRWSPDRSEWNLAAADGRVRRNLFDIVHLFPGLVIEFNGERFCAPNGLLDYCAFHGGMPSWTQKEHVEFQATDAVDGIRVQVAGLLTDRADDLKVFGFANGVSNRAGDHIDGLRSACEGRTGVCAVSVVMTDPKWAGPTKDKLAVPRVRDVVYEIVSNAMRSADS